MLEQVFQKNEKALFYPQEDSTFAISLSEEKNDVLELQGLVSQIFLIIDGTKSLTEINSQLGIDYSDVEKDYKELIEYLLEIELIELKKPLD